MTPALEISIWLSSLSFLAYGIAYFWSPKLQSEFVRFGLSKFGALTAVLEILGGFGLLVGLFFSSILLLSSGGLALLMFLGVITRIRVRDSIIAMAPALFFMGLNTYIFLAVFMGMGTA